MKILFGSVLTSQNLCPISNTSSFNSISNEPIHFSSSHKLARNDFINPNAVKILCKQIGKRLKRLECLTLDFSRHLKLLNPSCLFISNRCSRITDKALRSLTHFTTSYLRNLKDFRIIASRSIF